MKHFKAVIIGSGQGGTPLAKKLAKEGWKTALIEKNEVGGTCVNVGCTPTKTMVASAKFAYMVSEAQKFGVHTNKPVIDISAILARKNKVVESFRNGSQKGLEETENLELIFGQAAFTGIKQLTIHLNGGGEESITAENLFIDTGGHPTVPPIEGLQEAGYYTSTTLMELKDIPEHLLIIGGGYIGLEFGQMYRRFGSRVTILEHGKRFLSREDEDIADEIRQFMEAEEIEIFTGARVRKVWKQHNSIQVMYDVPDGQKEISCSHILVSAGRTPNTAGLNLQSAGIETSKHGHIKVNDKLETTAPGIYAIGDVKGGPEFTHISYNDHLVLFNNLVNGKNETIANRMVPYTMFTDPQLGRVGLTEQDARQKGLDIKVATLPMSRVARAIETGDTRGLIKAVVDTGGKIWGVAVVGQEGGEIMTVLQMAMAGGITYPEIADMIFAHPLYAESLNNLFMSLKD